MTFLHRVLSQVSVLLVLVSNELDSSRTPETHVTLSHALSQTKLDTAIRTLILSFCHSTSSSIPGSSMVVPLAVTAIYTNLSEVSEQSRRARVYDSSLV